MRSPAKLAIDTVDFRALRLVGMFSPGVDLQLFENLPAKSVVRQHSFDCMFKHPFRMFPDQILKTDKRRASGISCVMEVLLQFRPVSRELDL